MKIKRFLSGFFAAVMSIVLIAAPLSTAIAVKADPDETETNEDECRIIINHAASTGTYTAYPIFVGNVELEPETGRKLIDNPTFHENLKTAITNEGSTTDSGLISKSESKSYGLWAYLKTNGAKINGVSFCDLIKAYDPNSAGTFSLGDNLDASKQAEALANILNLTSADSAVKIITGNNSTYGKNYSAFYSAFAEAARMFMVDNITSGTKGTLIDVSESVSCAEGSNSVTIKVNKPGYYLVEYTPDDYEPTDYDSPPKKVRRSLVLVGKGDALSATINSKDTQNIASVDVTFNENILDKSTCEGETPIFNYPGGETKQTASAAEEHWKKNVSAGNGDYVNCRVVVTLPGNLAAYDQYYLAVPIMYGYNATDGTDFDKEKSITRKGKEENVKVYFLDGENKIYISNDNFIICQDYTYANNSTTNTGGLNNDKDWFVAKEAFEFKDIANIDVKADEAADPVLAKNSNYNKLVIEFPVEFNRFNATTVHSGTLMGVGNLGFNGADTSYTNYNGDDALLKNYITAKAVYSNNPNLKALTADEKNDDGTLKDSNKHLYLDTSNAPGTLQNPVGITKESSSANIVTYRLRVHATTEDLKALSQTGGVEGIRFVLYDNTNKKYALVTTLQNGTGDLLTYDTVSGEILRDNTSGNNSINPNNKGKVRVYKITGWEENYKNSSGEDEEETLNDNCVLTTFNSKGSYTAWANNNTGRFEIVGLAPGDYTIITLDETIKTFVEYKSNSTDNDWKEYLLPKEKGERKTEYRFSFAPELSDTCTKQLYYTHFKPKNYDDATLSSNFTGSVTTKHDVDVSNLITNFNMNWYDKDGNAIIDETSKPDWWLGQRDDVNLMSMRITYIKKGLSLPVTGGIGTFIFYAVGGVLVIISIVAIITKIRIKREQL